ncbi:hypothetical protein [Autumnicola psychrophila]|uniref:DUF4440 domain-containing protein n=1 Tax=Autumnicola psychrophila TaxID=3075592 RepID=A0ABU3DRV4_9FLAO|nr:hypothetical protein [Zunongwangia sp. F225]MDT0686440.1 hypothetical protein [Zunongwangia sp. F225]
MQFGPERNEEIQEEEPEIQDEVTVENEINNPENLMQDWDRLWEDDGNDSNNEAESLRFRESISNDAVLLTGGRRISTVDSITSWFNTNAATMRGLAREATLDGSGETIKYQAGTFSNVETMQEEGTYTIIWEQESGDSQWKIKLIDISSAENSNQN